MVSPAASPIVGDRVLTTHGTITAFQDGQQIVGKVVGLSRLLSVEGTVQTMRSDASKSVCTGNPIFIFRKQKLMCLDDRGRIGAFSLRRRYSLHQHSITGIKRTDEIFTQRLSLRRREFKDLGDLLGRRHPICRNRFNQRSPHHPTFRGFRLSLGKNHGAVEGEDHFQKALRSQVRAVSRSKVWLPILRYLLKSASACHRFEVR